MEYKVEEGSQRQVWLYKNAQQRSNLLDVEVYEEGHGPKNMRGL